jgi:hypothetical protein
VCGMAYIEVMRELDIDLSDREPQFLTRELAEQADLIVTMGCGDQCPYIPGKRYLDGISPTRRAARSRRFARPAGRSLAASIGSLTNSTTMCLTRVRLRGCIGNGFSAEDARSCWRS